MRALEQHLISIEDRLALISSADTSPNATMDDPEIMLRIVTDWLALSQRIAPFLRERGIGELVSALFRSM